MKFGNFDEDTMYHAIGRAKRSLKDLLSDKQLKELYQFCRENKGIL